jgi:hypothetical protein
MLCRRCRRPLANPRSIKRRFGAYCWAKEREEYATAAQGDLFEGWEAWLAYQQRRPRSRHRLLSPISV